MKITNNQEAQTSTMLDALLKLKRQQTIIKTRWIILPILVLLLMYSWQQHIFTGWVLIPFIWVVAVINMTLVAHSRNKKLQKIDNLRFDPIFWKAFEPHYPYLTLKQRQLIEQGFKDYLALHAMQKQAYAMPSHAVDALWHVMLEYPVQYQQLCQQTIGRKLNHQPYDSSITPEEQTKQLLEAWKYSCMLHQYQPRNTSQLPRLFTIDQALNWQGGQHFELEKMTKDYAQYLKDQSSSSSSCGGSSCGGCGGD